jgi:D-2-hydroxyacid dehydrogenase (NADP+)
MKKDAVFINIGRGSAVNEEDLIEVLKNQSIKGAALDVFKEEPLPESSPFW